MPDVTFLSKIRRLRDMPRYLRTALAVLAGLVVAHGVVFGIEFIGHAVLSGAYLFVAPVVAYLLAAFLGVWVAIRLDRHHALGVALAIVVVLLALALANLAAFPHPMWFSPAAAVALAAGGWAAWECGADR
ncbi:hypothetical protein [Dyella koreensis]|uniref:Uncharacterized protein n=1 Tax=Dyella koreensis TaxID=311235 RepID=A0ABW8K8T1_9GAMM